MRRVVLVALALAAFAGCASTKRATASPHTAMLRSSASMDMLVGEVVTLPAEDLREYGLDGEDVVDVRAEPKDHPTTVTVTARKMGTTTLFLVDKDSRVVRRAIRVGHRTFLPQSLSDQLTAELADVSCVRLVREGSAIVIEVTALSDTERLQLEQLKDDYAARHIELRFVPAACAAAVKRAPDAGSADAGSDVDDPP